MRIQDRNKPNYPHCLIIIQAKFQISR
uniref:Uncharacterized protein n=1 Tax=Rhizophora mucronata TaxID=61149 RepID=A0A2P2N8R7_RHIMU